ncbi:MAG: ParB/RepB/Spo0J family partition protein [Rhodothermales bacterium]|nr:ParB/RepB/Spo0J family partition protein [Rhodothermales bacterium]MBO6779497.1 ParB/RepB/Spo0J family partition protein [Rhodothermales bacterium]
MAKGKAALGRGLGALLPDREEQAAETAAAVSHTPLYDFRDRQRAGAISDVAIGRIKANPYQPRTEFDQAALEELAASIEQLGIIQPVTVRATDSGDFELISGERRLRAARMAGLEHIPAFVREADTEAMLEMAIVENVQREQLNPIEVALGYLRLVEECTLTQEEVATKVGKGRATVTNLLRLLKLPPAVQAMLRDGRLSTGHARALIPLEDPDVQATLAARIVDQELSVRATEKMVKQWLNAGDDEPEPAVAEPPSRDDLELRRLTDRLRGGLGTKVAIRPSVSGEGGKIEVEYYSADDLERLIELMGR